MDKHVIPFDYNGREIRIVDIDGDPWWVGRDVCDVLGITNSRDAIAKVLDDDEKGVATIYTPGGAQSMTIVSEPGLYSLIMRSRMPAAKAFSRWVRHEVLPALRRTGTYSIEGGSISHEDPQVSARAELTEGLIDKLTAVYGQVNVGARIDHLMGYRRDPFSTPWNMPATVTPLGIAEFTGLTLGEVKKWAKAESWPWTVSAVPMPSEDPNAQLAYFFSATAPDIRRAYYERFRGERV